jgi:membrane-bound lytic murein transglycosylase MltF
MSISLPRIAKYFVLISLLNLSCKKEKEPVEVAEVLDSTVMVDADTVVFSFNPENEFLGLGKPEFGDLDSMIARRRIRALVPYTQSYYYIDGKERKGIAFEALNLYEAALNKQLKFYPPKIRVIFIPVNRSQIIPLLQDGYADVAYAGLTITDERKREVDFSSPTISGLKEIIVGGLTAPKLNTLADLSGKEIFLRTGSSFESAVMKLNDSLKRVGLKPAIIKPVDPYLETEDMLQLVDAGVIPYTATVLDFAKLWSNFMDSLVLYDKIPLATDVAYGLAFRKGSPKLKASIDKFVAKNRKGTLMGNMLYNKYVTDVKHIKKMHRKQTIAQVKALRSTFQTHATSYKLDWLLCVAQGYQESKLQQGLTSHAGAVGIMQVKPSTAAGRPIYIKNIRNVNNNIHAGIKYMRFIIDQYYSDPAIDSLNKHLLALASYNAGPARIAGLRRRAKARGLNPNIWFDNVELIAAREIGRETVQYVSNIYKFYASYRALDYYISKRNIKLIE